ncbi:hypothetical protein P9112_009579 [Eukaryota sp. TZLM1-RC]
MSTQACSMARKRETDNVQLHSVGQSISNQRPQIIPLESCCHSSYQNLELFIEDFIQRKKTKDVTNITYSSNVAFTSTQNDFTAHNVLPHFTSSYKRVKSKIPPPVINSSTVSPSQSIAVSVIPSGVSLMMWEKHEQEKPVLNNCVPITLASAEQSEEGLEIKIVLDENHLFITFAPHNVVYRLNIFEVFQNGGITIQEDSTAPFISSLRLLHGSVVEMAICKDKLALVIRSGNHTRDLQLINKNLEKINLYKEFHGVEVSFINEFLIGCLSSSNHSELLVYNTSNWKLEKFMLPQSYNSLQSSRDGFFVVSNSCTFIIGKIDGRTQPTCSLIECQSEITMSNPVCFNGKNSGLISVLLCSEHEVPITARKPGKEVSKHALTNLSLPVSLFDSPALDSTSPLSIEEQVHISDTESEELLTEARDVTIEEHAPTTEGPNTSHANANLNEATKDEKFYSPQRPAPTTVASDQALPQAPPNTVVSDIESIVGNAFNRLVSLIDPNGIKQQLTSITNSLDSMNSNSSGSLLRCPILDTDSDQFSTDDTSSQVTIIPSDELEVNFANGAVVADDETEIFKALWNGEPVGVKFLTTDGDDVLMREYYLLRKLSSPYVVQAFGCCQIDGRFGIVIEEPTTLNVPQSLSVSCVRYATHATKAVKFLHLRSTVHCDIKPTSFGLFGDKVKLIDVRNVKVVKDTYVTVEPLSYPLSYSAPELIAGEACKASDVYGLGIFIYEITCNKKAYENTALNRLFGKKMQGRPPVLDASVPSELQGLLQQCCILDVTKRPTLDEILVVLEGLYRICPAS